MGDHKDPVDLGIETSAQPTNQSVDYQPLVNGDPKEPEGSKSGDDPETEMSPEMKEALAHRRRSVTFSDALGVNEVPAEELEGAYANGECPADVAIERHRVIFRAEMLRLNAELEAFKRQCREEMVRYAKDVERQKAELQTQLEELAAKQKAEEELRSVKTDLEDLASENDMLLRRQAVIDQQAEILGREEELTRRQKGLEDYEKEIMQIERYLDRRYTVAKEKEKEVHALDEELRTLAADLKRQKEALKNDENPADASQEYTQERDREAREQEAREKEKVARKNRSNSNWDFLQKSLMEKQVTLESALRRLKFELTTVEGRNSELTLRVSYLESELGKRNRKVKELETQLSLTIGQMRAQEEERVSPARPMRKSLLYSHGDPSINGSTLTLSTQSALQGSVIDQQIDRPRTVPRSATPGSRYRQRISTQNLHKPDTWVMEGNGLHRRSLSERGRKITPAPSPSRTRCHSEAESLSSSRKPSQTCIIM